MTQIELLEEELQKLEVKYISMILEYRKEKRLIFEKAKETLYTEEQVREVIRNCFKSNSIGFLITEDDMIRTIKQPKKD